MKKALCAILTLVMLLSTTVFATAADYTMDKFGKWHAVDTPAEGISLSLRDARQLAFEGKLSWEQYDKYRDLVLSGQVYPYDNSDVVIEYPEKGAEYRPNQIWVRLKPEYSRSSEEPLFKPEDFPELDIILDIIVEVDNPYFLLSEESRGDDGCLHFNNGKVYSEHLVLKLSDQTDISLEEAFERIARNPMVAHVSPIYLLYLDDIMLDDEIRFIGDVNGDFRVNSKDIIAVMKHISGVLELSDRDRPFADVNGDGKINAKDIIEIMRLMLVTWA